MNTSNKIINNTKNTIFNKINNLKHDNIENHPYIVLFMLIIILGFIIYGFYYYYKYQGSSAHIGKSFYDKNIINYTPVFKIKSINNISECIERCNMDILCNGITYNTSSQECIGTGQNGILRDDDSNLISWIKPENKQIDITTDDFTKQILFGFSDKPLLISNDKIIHPRMPGHFVYSFNLTIKDFYINYGKWRHVFHKGTNINTNQPLIFTSWENLILDIPFQSIGVWIAPFSNNLRIAITTSVLTNQYKNIEGHPNIQICDSINNICSNDKKSLDKKLALDDMSIKPSNLRVNLEFIENDIKKFPINKPFNITINTYQKIIEIYLDGKLINTSELEGTPLMSNDPLFIMYPNSFYGSISNFLYLPNNITARDIDKIINIPKYEN